MHTLISRRHMIATSLCACATPVLGQPRRYQLEMARSVINFAFLLNGTTQRGTLPVQTAKIVIDTDSLEASSALVTADVSRARTGFALMTQALLSAAVLNANAYPTVTFQSTKIILGREGRISEGAQIAGLLTLRGITHPIQLSARVSRPFGTPANALDTLTVQLTGDISRSRFGATGYPALVADAVALDIRAELRATS